MALFDTIFFDVDGTLVDSRKDITNAVNHALGTLGFRKLSVEAVVSYVGTGVKDLIRKCFGTDDEAIVEKGDKLYWKYFMEHAVDESVLYPHAREILEYLKDKRKFILTNRYKDFAEATLKGLGIIGYFEEIIGGDDENCMKPLACLFDRIVPRLKVDRKNALIIGDMDIDIQAGKNSGIKTCWITHGLGRVEDVKALNPDYIIEDLIELKEIIK